MVTTATVIGQAFASAIVGQLVMRLSSPIWAEIGLLLKLKEDLANMKETLLTLMAVLKDAERQSGRKQEMALRLWLKRLKTAAYEIDDMLSGFEDKIRKKKENVLDNMVQNVEVFFSYSNQVKLRVVMAHKIKEMRKKLDFIAAERSKFNFNMNTESSEQDQDATGRETTSVLIDERAVIGRDEEKEELVRMLLDNSNEQVNIIPIVGLGGLGKTTLAQLLYNDEKVRKAFQLKAWSYVSTKFDLKKIGEDLIECIKGIRSNSGSKNIVHNKVKEELKGKRFLIVLDDVWEEDGKTLEELKQWLQSSAGGSKVILTTRSASVARMIHGNEPYFLKVLSDEHCWVLFSQRAFKSEAERTNETYVEVGKEIVRKCKGSPLAARSLGFTMRLKKGIDSWYEVRDDHIWDESGSLYENTILPSLKSSYYNMPSHLKMCFTYCSIFPKGCFIRENELIQEWIGLGFIRAGRRRKLEQIGEEYVAHLINLSFLQCGDYFSEENPILHMHDLVHDLAMSIANDEVLFLDGEVESFDGTHCRYARLTNYNEAYSACKFLPKTLRALYLERCTIELESKCFNKVKGLHVLCLERGNVVNLPKSIGKLKQLRYLRAQNLEIRTLPESISQLHNLIALDLSAAAFDEVPIYISKLDKLCFLSLSWCKHLRELNDSITKLKNLKHLDLSWCCEIGTLPTSLGDLHDLSFLNLSHCEKLEELPQHIGKLKSLEHLDLSFCEKLKKLPESFVDCCNLRVLKLNDCYDLQAFPESLSNLSNLEILNLSNCENLTELPNSFGDLKKLKVLNLSSCSLLQSLPNSIGKLVSLENLDISDCQGLKEITKYLGNLKKLRSLNLARCGANYLPENIGKLTNLEFLELPQIVTLPCIAQLVNLTKLEKFVVLDSNIRDLENLNCLEGELQIYNLENEKTPQEIKNDLLCHKSNLHYLHLSWSNTIQVEPSPSGILEKLRPHANLQSFMFSNCPAKVFPNWMINVSDSLPNLTKIIFNGLSNCNNLPPLGQLQNLRKLGIISLPGIKKVDKAFAGGNLQPFKRLTKLELRDMQNLEEWSTLISNRGESNVFMFPNLVKFRVIKCGKLKFTPCLPQSIDLIISKSDEVISSTGSTEISYFKKLYMRIKSIILPEIISSTGSRDISNFKTLYMRIKSSILPANSWGVLESFSTVKYLEIQKCKELRSLPETIRGLTSLESLGVKNCNNLIELGENVQYLMSLKKLEISSTENLAFLPESIENLISLEELIIRYCPKLECLPESIKNLSLKTLRVWGCTTLLENCLQRDRDRIAHILDFSTEEVGWESD